MTGQNITHACKALYNVAVVAARPLLSASTKIYVANSDDDKISVIDPATDKVVGEISVSPNPHGIVSSADGARFYVSSDSKDLLDVIDRKSGRIIRKIPIGTHRTMSQSRATANVSMSASGVSRG